MAYLPQFDEDVFVSYAHMDDEVVSGSGQGWVTEVIKCLKFELGRRLGRSDAYSLWIDHELLHSHPLTPQILERVQRSATMVVMLSPCYVASQWCQKEREAFFGSARASGLRNVFVVEIEPVDDRERPTELADFKAFRFWARTAMSGAARQFGWPRPQQTDADFYGAVKDLAEAIADELRRIRTAHPDAPAMRQNHAGRPTPAAALSGGTVYLAQVTDDLDSERSSVRRFLEQAGIRVVPRSGYYTEPRAFPKAAAADIAAADLVVQLLSGVTGKRPPDLPEGYLQCQLQLALDAGKPVMQWHSPALDTHGIEDASHRALLERSTVSVEPIEDFKQAVRSRLDAILRPPPVPTPAQTDALIFVDMDAADRPLADNLCDILDRYGAGYILPKKTEDPGDYRKDLECNLSSCDALMVVYGESTAEWVRNHLRECHKSLVGRTRPPRGIALLQAPPGPKDRLEVRLPNMKLLDCQDGVNEAAIAKFLATLQSEAR